MKRRLIIHIRTAMSDYAALSLVAQVVAGGRISETAGRKHYCHLSTYGKDGKGQINAVKRSDGTDTFYVL